MSQIYVHIVFHIKCTAVEIRLTDKEKLFAYIGSVIKSNESIPIIINGTHNHVHIHCVMSKNITLAKLVEKIKRHSSRWIKTIDEYYKTYAWQGGYGGFSVSPSVHDKTIRYIENQEIHHQTMNFQDEYRMFLAEYKIDYDEHYVWTD